MNAGHAFKTKDSQDNFLQDQQMNIITAFKEPNDLDENKQDYCSLITAC